MRLRDKISSLVYRLIGFKGGFDTSKQDERDYLLLGKLFGYTPKRVRTNNAAKILEVKQQKRINSCVCESGATQKENDEGITLDPQFGAIWLRKTGKMTSKGTSLSAWQYMLKTVGVCKKGLLPNNYDMGWWAFSDKKLLTDEMIQNAKIHRSKSYWKTHDLDNVLEQLDKGKLGQTGSNWYSGWNNLKAPYIIYPNQGLLQGGHAFTIVDYDTDYNGQKVVKCINSASNKWADKGYFYIKWADFNKILQYGVYFNEDEPQDKFAWVSMHQHRAVKEVNSPKCWFIEGKYKRYIPDEALLTMLGFHPESLVIDEDNMLPKMKKGADITIDDIHVDKRKQFKYMLAQRKDIKFLKDRYYKYFPSIF